MICSSGRSTTSTVMSLRMLDARTRGSQSETGLGPKAKWGLTPVSVQAGCVRPSGLCFIGVRVKAKRNGYFQGCHWETLGPRPPEYGYKQEGPVKLPSVARWPRVRQRRDGLTMVGRPRACLSRVYPLYTAIEAFLSLRKVSAWSFTRWRAELRATSQFNHMLFRQLTIEPPLVEAQRDNAEPVKPVLMGS